MTEPWTEVLDRSCSEASGQTTSSGAATTILQYLYSDLGLLYDSYSGASFYTGYDGGQYFNLTNFLNQTPGSYLDVNCTDMGFAIIAFTNAIGCNMQYATSTPFKYLNCILPVGGVWTNNPFYLNGNYNPNPIMDGDTQYGRSYFGYHAFAFLGTTIFDATFKVDTDNDPDYGPPHTETWIIGDSWTGYKSKVLDTYPYPQSGDYVQDNSWYVK